MHFLCGQVSVFNFYLWIASNYTQLTFIFSYRNNEVNSDHVIFPFIADLVSSGIPTEQLTLGGLRPTDLNYMISDALCLLPRICEPLSDIVYQKTRGNPFFALSFLKSLVDDRRILEYCDHERRWIWDEDLISSMEIAGNVLHLFTSKINGLADDVRTALKLAACFGTKLKESLARHLSTTPRYENICNGLEQSCNLGFMIKVGTWGWRFVHDKVCEAALTLIPDLERNQVSICCQLLTVQLNLISHET